MKGWVYLVVGGTFLGALLGWLASLSFLLLAFHPSREWRLFGRRLPLTPGIYLKHRGAIAEFLGGLVERELAGEDLLAERLADPEVKRDLEAEIRRRLDAAVARPSGELLGGLGLGPDSLPLGLAKEAWTRFAASAQFSQAMAAALGSALALVEDLPLSLLLPPARARETAERFFSAENLARFEGAAGAWIARALEKRDRLPVPLGMRAGEEGEGDIGPRGVFVAGLIPAASLEPLVALFVETLYSAALPVIERFLNEGDTRRLIERSANEIVHRAIGRLSLVQRLIVGAANYERGITESMPDTVEDLVSMVSNLLRSPTMRGQAREAAVSAWREGLGALGAGDFLGDLISRQAILDALSATVKVLREDGPRLAERAALLATGKGEATLGSLLAFLGISGRELLDRGSLDLSSIGKDSPAGVALARSIESFAASLLASLAPEPLGALIGVEEGFMAAFSGWVAARSLELVALESPGIMKGLELRKVVVDKILTMDNSEVERVVLRSGRKGVALLEGLAAGLGALIGALEGIVLALSRGV